MKRQVEAFFTDSGICDFILSFAYFEFLQLLEFGSIGDFILSFAGVWCYFRSFNENRKDTCLQFCWK